MKYTQARVGPYMGMQVVHNEQTYEFNGSNWFDTQSKGIPPLITVARLNATARELLLGQHT